MAKTKVAPVDSAVSAAVESAQSRERLFMECAAAKTLSPDQTLALANCGLDWAVVEQQLARCRNVIRRQAEAGTEDERHAAEVLAEQAEARACEVRRKAAEEIERLEAEVRKAETEAATRRREHEVRVRAVENLRKLAPQFLQQMAERHRGAVKHQFGEMMAELQNAVATYEAAKKMRPENGGTDLEATVTFCRVHRPDLLVIESTGGERTVNGKKVTTGEYRRTGVNRDGWHRLLEELRKAAEAAEPQLARLEAEREAALSESAEMLNLYVPI